MNDEYKILKLGGRSLRCIPRIPPGVVFDLAEAMESGSDMKAIAGMSRMIKTVVIEEDRAELAAALNDADVSFSSLNPAIGELMVQYSSRPLGKPYPSSTGSGTDGGTRKVVSLSRATVRTEPMSSKDGASIAS